MLNWHSCQICYPLEIKKIIIIIIIIPFKSTIVINETCRFNIS